MVLSTYPKNYVTCYIKLTKGGFCRIPYDVDDFPKDKKNQETNNPDSNYCRGGNSHGLKTGLTEGGLHNFCGHI